MGILSRDGAAFFLVFFHITKSVKYRRVKREATSNYPKGHNEGVSGIFSILYVVLGGKNDGEHQL